MDDHIHQEHPSSLKMYRITFVEQNLMLFKDDMISNSLCVRAKLGGSVFILCTTWKHLDANMLHWDGPRNRIWTVVYFFQYANTLQVLRQCFWKQCKRTFTYYTGMMSSQRYFGVCNLKLYLLKIFLFANFEHEQYQNACSTYRCVGYKKNNKLWL